MPATKIVVNIPGEAPYDVRIGDAVLEVQAKKKKCHPDVCPLTEGRADCLLKKQSRYVTVAESGTLVRGAQVQAEEIQ